MILHAVMYSAINNTVTLCFDNKEVGMEYRELKKLVPDLFSVDDIYSLNYEKERELFIVHRCINGDKYEEGLDNAQELIWIDKNLEKLRVAANEYLLSTEWKPTFESERFNKFEQTDWLVQRHQEQKALGIATSLSEEQFQKLLDYRQALRDLGEIYQPQDLAENVVWPTEDFKSE
jgi:hypothetical protein